MCGGGILGSANDEQIAPNRLLFHDNTVKPTNHARPSGWMDPEVVPFKRRSKARTWVADGSN